MGAAVQTRNKILDHALKISDCMCVGVWFEFYIPNSISDQGSLCSL